MCARAGGKYYHNIKSAVPTPGTQVMNGAIGHVDLDQVWPYTFPQQLREKKGYATGAQQSILNPPLRADLVSSTWKPVPHLRSESAAVVLCLCAQRCLGSA